MKRTIYFQKLSMNLLSTNLKFKLIKICLYLKIFNIHFSTFYLRVILLTLFLGTINLILNFIPNEVLNYITISFLGLTIYNESLEFINNVLYEKNYTRKSCYPKFILPVWFLAFFSGTYYILTSFNNNLLLSLSYLCYGFGTSIILMWSNLIFPYLNGRINIKLLKLVYKLNLFITTIASLSLCLYFYLYHFNQWIALSLPICYLLTSISMNLKKFFRVQNQMINLQSGS